MTLNRIFFKKNLKQGCFLMPSDKKMPKDMLQRINDAQAIHALQEMLLGSGDYFCSSHDAKIQKGHGRVDIPAPTPANNK
jgi:hypothetical protein